MIIPALDAGIIACRSEQLRKSHDVCWQWCRKTCHPDINGISACHKCGPGRHALRGAGIHLRKPHTVAGDFVDMRCINIRVAVTAKVWRAMVVAQYKQDVGTLPVLTER